MLILQKMPEILPTYFKAALTARRRPGKVQEIPAMAASLSDLRFDAVQLAAYCEVCGFTPDEHVPITFPQVVATAMHMHLMTRPEFPLPMMGLVHLRNSIAQTRALRVDEVLTVNAAIEAGGRMTDKGLEFDIITEFLSEGRPVYHAVTTILYRGHVPPKKDGSKKTVVEVPSALAQYIAFDAPGNTGRRYGKVSGDLNPIHLSAASAKLFGFPRAIAHGMWSLARCAALVQAQLGQPPRELTVTFKQPLLLPGKVAMKYRTDAKGIEFSLLSRSSGKVHLSGSLR